MGVLPPWRHRRLVVGVLLRGVWEAGSRAPAKTACRDFRGSAEKAAGWRARCCKRSTAVLLPECWSPAPPRAMGAPAVWSVAEPWDDDRGLRPILQHRAEDGLACSTVQPRSGAVCLRTSLRSTRGCFSLPVLRMDGRAGVVGQEPFLLCSFCRRLLTSDTRSARGVSRSSPAQNRFSKSARCASKAEAYVVLVNARSFATQVSWAWAALAWSDAVTMAAFEAASAAVQRFSSSPRTASSASSLRTSCCIASNVASRVVAPPVLPALTFSPLWTFLRTRCSTSAAPATCASARSARAVASEARASACTACASALSARAVASRSPDSARSARAVASRAASCALVACSARSSAAKRHFSASRSALSSENSALALT
mmetsp:Transcript_35574/g.99983  ORF Transcript_35574/g.99983 Transcript_35574/m.99983 type:complete len:373 (-) Transcript_35574:1105-2223(-)